MRKKLLLTCLGFGIAYTVLTQNILQGSITDSEKSPISNAHISFPKLDTILVSDSNGKFSIQLFDELYNYAITHVEYDTLVGALTIEKDTAINFQLHERFVQFKEVVIYGLRSDENTPIAFIHLENIELNAFNYGQDMPLLLQNTVSAVATSDAGNGIGYTSLRIRGSDATRMNVTINGVPFNDAESHQSYWVDIPDIAISADEVQVQRGVGFSTNGPGAFGASINIFTNTLKEEPMLQLNTSFGSFNLFRTNMIFSSGRFKEHWFVEGSGSYTNANGYIDRSFAELRSFFFTAGYDAENYRSIINIIGGKERTYQSWGGVPADSLEVNRTFNPYTYENQTDNYNQTHLQWHHNFFLPNSNNLNITFNYTKGKGFFEQLENQQLLSSYGIEEVTIEDSLIEYSDMITQKWLDNDFYGVIIDYNLNINNENAFLFGGAYFRYNGDHFNNIIWSEYGEFGIPPFTYYEDNATKDDANVFAQWKYYITSKLKLILDMQLRTVNYHFNGFDLELNTIPQSVVYTFLNPKAGLIWKGKSGFETYLQIAYTSKEPNRDDFIYSSISSRPKPEQLIDLELGAKKIVDGWLIQPNFYFMYYKDQLVMDGSINDVGAYTRINVPKSYRMGFELSLNKTFWDVINTFTYATVSQNKIINYTQFYDNWETGEQEVITYSQSDIAFSPNFIGGLQLDLEMIHLEQSGQTVLSADIGLDSKYISSQFLDNTRNSATMLDSYFVSNLKLKLELPMPKSYYDITMSFVVSNIFNTLYESSGWVYSYYLDEVQNNLVGYYPQAGRTYYLKISIGI